MNPIVFDIDMEIVFDTWVSYMAMRHELATQKGWFCYAFQDFETLN